MIVLCFTGETVASSRWFIWIARGTADLDSEM